MAISSTTTRIGYTGTGSQTAFTFPYTVYDASALLVYVNGVLQTIGSQYTVALTNVNPEDGNPVGATVTFLAAPANGASVQLVRSLPLTQTTVLNDGGNFPAKTIEKTYDTLTMIVQQQNEQYSRTMHAPTTEPLDMTLPAQATRANTFLAFDTNGQPYASVGGTSGVPVSPYMATVLNALTAGAALTTLGIPLTAFPAYTQSGNVDSTATGYFDLPAGTTAQRPGSPTSGYVRFNTDTLKYEGYNGTTWGLLGGGATGGGSDALFYENDQTVNNNYTITSGKNAMSAGPITIASGKTVTVTSGSTWSII